MTITMISPDPVLVPVEPAIRGTLLDIVQPSGGVSSRPDNIGLFETFNGLATDALATFPCPATFLSAPTQSAPSTATTGGTLGAGTYRAKITAIDSRGETTASAEQSQVTTGGASTVTWNWGAVSGASGYNIYVTVVNGSANSEHFLVTVGAVTTYVWTGTPAASTTTAVPPTVNTAVLNVTKTFGDPSWQDGFQFAVYTGVKCKAVSFDPVDAANQLDRVFRNKESNAVARALMTNRFVNGSPLNWGAATDITPSGGAVDPSVGLAMLEEHAGANYAGQPIFHFPRSIGSLVTRNGQAELDGDILRSSLGTPIAADPGYGLANVTSGTFKNIGPSGSAPSAGELWCYASGGVSLHASDPIRQGGDVRVGFAANETGDSNIVRVLQERAYLAAVDYYTAAVRVKVQ